MVQFLKSALIAPTIIINVTTHKFTPVKILFIKDDSLTPSTKIPNQKNQLRMGL